MSTLQGHKWLCWRTGEWTWVAIHVVGEEGIECHGLGDKFLYILLPSHGQRWLGVDNTFQSQWINDYCASSISQHNAIIFFKANASTTTSSRIVGMLLQIDVCTWSSESCMMPPKPNKLVEVFNVASQFTLRSGEGERVHGIGDEMIDVVWLEGEP